METNTNINNPHSHRKSYYRVRYQEMLDLRLGGMILQEIGDIYGVSRERVRQIIKGVRRPERVKSKRGPSDKRRKDRKYALELLGGVCVRCGFSDSRALQIDHINGGGTKALREKGSSHAHREVINMNPTERMSTYQILCANCNWIKKAENGENNSRTYIDKIKNIS